MNDYYKPKNREKKKDLHFHLWPRYEKPVEFEGDKFFDEVFGHHYDKTKEKYVSESFLSSLKTKLLSNFPNQQIQKPNDSIQRNKEN